MQTAWTLQTHGEQILLTLFGKIFEQMFQSLASQEDMPVLQTPLHRLKDSKSDVFVCKIIQGEQTQIYYY